MDPTQRADVLTGTTASDTIDGLDGPDQIDGGEGADRLSGGGGADEILGGAGNDVIFGFGAVDTEANSGAIVATRVAAGLTRPVFALSAPGDPGRLFVVEQHTADIRILDLSSNTIAATPFLDIPINEITRGGEQGLLGLAFHPDYVNNGRFYVNLTNAAGDHEVWEYTRSSANPDVADFNSRRLLLTFDQPQGNHNGGWIDFGPDGFLYIATGDGGGSGDPGNNAQNINSLLGKILRIDVNGDAFPGDPNANYAIPAGNPFVGVDGADEVFALGLRNPWRISFDDANGDLYIGDVGQNRLEELDFIAAGTAPGVNFGWRVLEGTLPFPNNPAGNPQPDDPGLTGPILEYRHVIGPDGGLSITGGYVYHGPGGAQGLYFFGDFVSAQVWTVHVVDGQPVDFLNRIGQFQVDAGDIDQIASFALDGTGRLYLIGLDGDIHRLSPTAAAADGADVLRGGDGDDEIHGGAGADQLFGDDGNDQLFGGLGDDTLQGGVGADTLSGGPGADAVQGGDGSDILDGGSGADTASYATATGPVSVSLAIAGAQNTRGAGSDTLSAIEHLTGSAFADELTGNGGGNRLDGGAGADTIRPGAGNDVIVIDNPGDVVVELNLQGVDTIETTINRSLDPNVENLKLLGTASINGSGNELANVLIGNAGNNALDGRGGGDMMVGGAGNDTYVVRAPTDVASELVNGGTDQINSFIHKTLCENVENLLLLGTSDLNGSGNALANRLTGNSGNNALDGKGGGDTMVGGAGDDTYVVREATDVVTEAVGGGIDQINSFINKNLCSNVENMLLLGTSNINGSGNALANRLTGNSGNNALDGKGGGDTLVGGTGNDTYVVREAGDIVTEAAAGGTDQINTFIDRTLDANVENMLLLGSGNTSATGNALANSLTGNGGNNALNGGLGNDTLRGGAGSDSFNFDTALGPTNIDSVQDFSVPNDQIGLDDAIFTEAGAVGGLSAQAFVIGGAATTADHRIVYDSGNGALFYDADGTGGSAATQFATLSPGLGLTNDDFVIM